VRAAVSKQDGKIVWGSSALKLSIRSLLPEVETFEYWTPSMNRLVSPPVVRNPAAASLRPSGVAEERPFYHRLSPEGFRTMPWSVWVQSPTSVKLLGSCLATEGTTFRLESGGVLKISPLRESPDGRDSFSVRCYFEFPWQTKGPWFGPEMVPGYSGAGVQIVAVDETGKHAYLIDGMDYSGNTQEVMLGMYDQGTFHIDAAGNAAEWKRIEMLRKSRLYVISSPYTGVDRVVELPGL
jgi:hypothetical protein